MSLREPATRSKVAPALALAADQQGVAKALSSDEGSSSDEDKTVSQPMAARSLGLGTPADAPSAPADASVRDEVRRLELERRKQVDTMRRVSENNARLGDYVTCFSSCLNYSRRVCSVGSTGHSTPVEMGQCPRQWICAQSAAGH